MDASHSLSALYRAKEILAFSALAKRQLFRGSISHYCCSHNFTLITRKYKPGDTGTFFFPTRRRDGPSRQGWSADEFPFVMPHHVDSHYYMDIDIPLLTALLAAAADHPNLMTALSLFNQSNTDSPDVGEETELIWSKAAFERLWNIGSDDNGFVSALNKEMATYIGKDFDGTLKDKWQAKKGATHLEAWAREFHMMRGSSAHGKHGAIPSCVWPASAHLAFASILFPLLLKRILVRLGYLTLNPYDEERLKSVNAYLMHDPFEHDFIKSEGQHPWQEIDTQVWIASVAHKFYGNTQA